MVEFLVLKISFKRSLCPRKWKLEDYGFLGQTALDSNKCSKQIYSTTVSKLLRTKYANYSVKQRLQCTCSI